MVEIANIIFLGVVFYFLYRKDREDREDTKKTIELFNTTVKNVLDQVESNTEKFYEMTSKMQIKHFENLEKHTSKLLKLLELRPAQVKPEVIRDEVRKLDIIEENEISKEEIQEDPFSEDNHIPIMQGLKVQFEGEEEIHPIEIN